MYIYKKNMNTAKFLFHFLVGNNFNKTRLN